MPFADCFNERSGDLVRLEGRFCSASLRSNFVEGGMMMRKRRRRPGTVNPRSLTKDRDLSIHPLVRTQKETKDWQQASQQQGVYKFVLPSADQSGVGFSVMAGEWSDGRPRLRSLSRTGAREMGPQRICFFSLEPFSHARNFWNRRCLPPSFPRQVWVAMASLNSSRLTTQDDASRHNGIEWNIFAAIGFIILQGH
jgi:hypothetical protein